MGRSIRTAVLAGWGISMVCGSAALGQYVMTPDRLGNRVLLLSGTDGSVVNADFIPDGGAVYELESPRAAVQVGNEIWVSDEASNAVHRFTASLTPTYIASLAGPLAMPRGMNVVGDRVYLAHNGTTGGAPGAAVLIYDFAGNQVGQFPTGFNTYDVIGYQGNLLVVNGAGDDLVRFTTSGTNLGIFHDSDGATGMDLPTQVRLASDGGVWVAGFSDPAGIYKFDATGAQTMYFAVPSTAVGIHELPDGNCLLVQTILPNGGIYHWSPATGATSLILSGPSFQLLHPLNLSVPPTCGTSDFNGDGDFGTDADIEAFFACLAGNCCGTCFSGGADFNMDGDTGTDADIEAFFRVLAGGEC